ncbi:MAG: helix-turn-helix domain-containing protein [Limnohabitans sp.]
MSDISQIDGQSVRRKRESLGLAIPDLATTACLSTKQIKQIEEGGMTAFYSESVKITAARKVAGLLGMTEAQLFGQVMPEVVQRNQPSSADDEFVEAKTSFHGELSSHSHAPAETTAISRSESWHFLAQPPENLEESEPASRTNALNDAPMPAQSHAENSAALASSASDVLQTTPPENSNANYLIKILALFLVALAVAALLRQQAGEEKAQSTSNELAPAVSPAPEPPPVMPVAQENSSQNPAPTTPTHTDPAVVSGPGADKATPLTSEPVSKPPPVLPDTPTATVTNK